MTAARVIQTFVRVCADCPNCTYYSGGVHHCTLTQERIMPDDKRYKVGEQCPLPFAGPPIEPPTATSKSDATSLASRYMVSVGLPEAKAEAIALFLEKTIGFKPLNEGAADAD